ncbi:hypothetical protein ACWDBW_23310 [Streptomyces sp. NPDC001107]
MRYERGSGAAKAEAFAARQSSAAGTTTPAPGNAINPAPLPADNGSKRPAWNTR